MTPDQTFNTCMFVSKVLYFYTYQTKSIVSANITNKHPLQRYNQDQD